MPERERFRPQEEQDRLDRQMLELINELRVALTGVQILFAFLLTVPFTQRFSTVTQFQKHLYFVTLLCAAAAVALLIAPSAQHRVLFGLRQKRRLLTVGNAEMIAGLGFLALAMTGVVMLITDLLFRAATVAVVTGAVGVTFATLWYIAPLARRIQRAREEAQS